MRNFAILPLVGAVLTLSACSANDKGIVFSITP